MADAVKGGNSGSRSVFDYDALFREEQLIKQGLFRQFEQVVVIDTTVLGLKNKGEAIPLPLCNGLVLIPSYFDENGTEILTDNVASRVAIKFNSKDSPWLPFSAINASHDFCSVNCTLFRMWVRVVAIGGAGAKMIFVPITSVAIAAGYSTGGVSAVSGFAPSGTQG